MKPWPAILRGASLMLLAGWGCQPDPRLDGFTSLAIAGSRRVIPPGGGASRFVTWPSVNLVMVENGPVLVTLETLRLTLEASSTGGGTLATLTGMISPQGYCTSPTWSGGIGQVVQVFFEKSDNSLVLPWTAGSFKVNAGGVRQALSFQQTLTGLMLDQPAQAELVVQPALWVSCP